MSGGEAGGRSEIRQEERRGLGNDEEKRDKV